MKVLLSAYACEPGGGSETGKGWYFAEALARYGCDVVVLTCGSHHRKKIEAHRANHGLPPNLDFVWHDVPGWRGPGYEQARHIRQHYLAWQITARRTVARLLDERSFDVIHHLTWTVLRWPSFLGGLGPRFVFGPVGGGEVAPHPLRASLPDSGRHSERIRDAINFASRFDPMVRGCLKRADAILVTDDATARHVPTRLRDKTFVVADIFAPEGIVTAPPARDDGAGPALLFAGRLESWKGPQLAVGALAELRQRLPGARLSIAGSGPDEHFIRQEARRLGMDGCVTFLGQVPHAQMASVYAAHDVLLYPSLHDSGPHVIGEALAHGLPVVCLDLGGPGVAIDESCGAVVRTAGLDVAAVCSGLVAAVVELVDQPDRLQERRRGAQARARRFTYAARVADMVDSYYQPR